ncbi:hypothetical protein AB0D65_22090 [Streptomyces griseoloalbus]|uniref:Lipoprotein n=1 Tax=Streptomyces griseoloalbus TaxID=67303 RepID=A0ABV3E8Y0_9ACTN
MTRIPRCRPRLLILLVAVGLLLAGCSSTVTTADTGHDSADPDPGTGHLHGLGVDPADGTVYAAGHHGVFRLDGGKVTRVAGRYQDTMGFTVTGPSTFLASGHPAPADPDARSPHLGLIRSTVGGRTFRPASSAPGLVAVEEPRSGLLVGLSADGRVLTGSGGGPWTQLGRLPAGGEATVLTTVSTRRLLAADTTDTRSSAPPCCGATCPP